MKPLSINMKFLKESRKRPKAGDIFVFKMPKVDYVFARVIKTDALTGTKAKLNLIYIYKAFSKDKHKIPKLDKHNLLVPPDIINNQGWLRGYFETIINNPLTKEDTLDKHCFLRIFDGKYYDEYGNELPRKIEPYGYYAVGNYRTVDDDVSKALGIPLAPE